jgi:hypothetical protein
MPAWVRPAEPQERERAAACAAAEAKRTEAERKTIADAQKIAAIWNARQAGGRALWFHPTTRDHQQVTSAPARREFFRPRRSS